MRFAVAVLALLLAGCAAAPAPAAVDAQADAVADDDGVQVVATRVEPLRHNVALAGSIEGRPCTGMTDECRFGTGGAGVTWDEPVADFGDAEALFWRADVSATSRSVLPNAGLHMVLYALKPCASGADGCFRERAVAEAHGPGTIAFNLVDVFLQPGEHGLRLRLQPTEHPEAAFGEAGLDYEVKGWVAGFRAVSEPVVVG